MSLANEWRKILGETYPAKNPYHVDSADAERLAWADEMIAKLPAHLQDAAKKGGTGFYLGDFRFHEWTPGKCDFYPTRDELKGGALKLFDFCLDEGLHLYISAENEHGLRWVPPFSAFIHLKR